MASGGISSRAVAIVLGMSIVATLGVGSAVAMRRSSGSTLEAGGSEDSRSSKAAFDNAIADADGVPLPTLDTDDDGESPSTTASPTATSSTVPAPATTVPSTGEPTTTTVPEEGPAQGPGILVMRPDGSDPTLVTNAVGWFSWSPDGTSLALVQAGRLVVVAADGSGERTLTAAGTGVFVPEWSPDGTRIAFGRTDGLFTVRADGSGAPTLVDAGGGYFSWSPDSRLSVATASGALTVYERDGSSRVLATNAFGPVAPAWARDGSRVAYLGDGIRVVNADGLAGRAVTGPCCGSEYFGSPLEWSPDGRRIAYIDLGDVRTVEVDTGAISILAAAANNPQWSPDGRSLAVIDQSIDHGDGLLNMEVAMVTPTAAAATSC